MQQSQQQEATTMSTGYEKCPFFNILQWCVTFHSEFVFFVFATIHRNYIISFQTCFAQNYLVCGSVDSSVLASSVVAYFYSKHDPVNFQIIIQFDLIVIA